MTSQASTYKPGSDFKYCVYILPKVSRTFALNINKLKKNSYRAVLIGYLLCRIIDTIEDSVELSADAKISLLKDFSNLIISTPSNPNFIYDWIKRSSNCTINYYENELIDNTDRVLRQYYLLPEDIRACMTLPILKMIKGMNQFIEKYKNQSLAQLADTDELIRYCYFVAGTVGELLSNIFTLNIVDNTRVAIIEKNKISFGIALQLTNILKDFNTDQKRGWSYIPALLLKKYSISKEDFFSWKHIHANRKITDELLTITWQYLKQAMRYLLALPQKKHRERHFCSIALFLAAETLIHLKSELYQEKRTYKISRKKVFWTVIRLQLINRWPFFLSRYFATLHKKYSKLN